jgi:hypothetical protein
MTAPENALLSSRKGSEYKVYVICVRNVGPFGHDSGTLYWQSHRNALLAWDPVRVDQALSPLGDWLRYNGLTWFVSTNLPAAEVNIAVRTALSSSADSVLVLRVEPSDFAGWAPPDVWSWFQSKQPRPTMSSYLQGRDE